MLTITVVNVESLKASNKKVDLDKLRKMIYALTKAKCIITNVSSYDVEEAEEAIRIKDYCTSKQLKYMYLQSLEKYIKNKYENA